MVPDLGANMGRIFLAASVLVSAASPAFAADITVLTSAVTAPALRTIADSWTATTGNHVAFKVGSAMRRPLSLRP